MKTKKLTLCGLLTALAVVLSLVERLFPLDAVVPVPGVKLGLANVVTLFALTRVSARDALAVVVCRVAISSLLMGSVTAFLFSLFGGLLALVERVELIDSTDRTIDLGGHNVIVLSGRSAAMQSADCRDQVCVRTGTLTHAGQVAVCLPNRVVLRITGETSEIDAIVS